MMTWLQIPEIDYASWLISINLKAFVLITLILGVSWFMRRASAATRHSILAAGVFVLLLLPATSVLFPTWNIGVVPSLSTSPGQTTLLTVDNTRAQVTTPGQTIVLTPELDGTFSERPLQDVRSQTSRIVPPVESRKLASQPNPFRLS